MTDHVDAPEDEPAMTANARNRVRLRSVVLQIALVLATAVQVCANLIFVLGVIAVATSSDSIVPSSPLVWVIICAWLGGGLILSVPQLWARRVAFNMRSFREPTAEERQLLTPAWSAVADRAGVRADDYGLAISVQDVCTSTGFIIVLTSNSVHNLTRVELEAVLAHELGHAMSINRMTTMAVAWYTLPGWWAILLGGWAYRAARWLVDFSYAATRATLAYFLPKPLPWLFGVCGAAWCVGWPLVALGAPVALLWLTPVFGTTIFISWLFRLCDKWADAMVADFGYGPVMVDLLSRGVQASEGASVGLWERILGRTLSPSTRQQVLGRYMANKGL